MGHSTAKSSWLSRQRCFRFAPYTELAAMGLGVEADFRHGWMTAKGTPTPVLRPKVRSRVAGLPLAPLLPRIARIGVSDVAAAHATEIAASLWIVRWL